MTSKGGGEWRFLVAASIACVLMAAGFAYLTINGPATFPEEAALDRVTGNVRWTRPTRYGIDFGFEGDEGTFHYSDKGGDFGWIAASLGRRSAQPVSIAIKADERLEGRPGEYFFHVYRVDTADGAGRSYRDIREGWMADYRYGYGLVALCLLAAGCLAYGAAKVREEAIASSKQFRRR